MHERGRSGNVKLTAKIKRSEQFRNAVEICRTRVKLIQLYVVRVHRDTKLLLDKLRRTAVRSGGCPPSCASFDGKSCRLDEIWPAFVNISQGFFPRCIVKTVLLNTNFYKRYSVLKWDIYSPWVVHRVTLMWLSLKIFILKDIRIYTEAQVRVHCSCDCWRQRESISTFCFAHLMQV